MLTRIAYLRIYLEAGELGRLGPGDSVHPRFDIREAGLLGEEPDARDLVTEWQGKTFVCPNNVRLRMLEGALAFYNAYSTAGGGLIVPEEVAQRAAKELERLYTRGPLARSHILTSAWFVPLRWFVPFDPDEKEVLSPDEVTGVRYRTPTRDARKRLARSLEALRGAGLDESVVRQVDELSEWVRGFPRGTMLELDYGTVAGLFSPAELVLDDTAADVWASIKALEQGDLSDAGEHYASAASRWAPAMAVTYSN